MLGIRAFLVGLLFGIAISFVALRYHVVRHQEGVIVVPRAPQPPLRTIYADVRDWSAAMWQQHAELTQAIIKSGRADLMATGLIENALSEAAPESEIPAAPQEEEQERLVPVPIRFTSSTSTTSPEKRAPSPISGLQSLLGLGNRSSEQSTTSPSEQAQPSSPTSDAIELGSSFIPTLDHPIPLSDPDVSALRKSQSQESLSDEMNWTRGLLRALIPQDSGSTEGGATQQDQDHSASHFPFPVEAPRPGTTLTDRGNDAPIPGVQPQPPLRAVRPF